MERDIAIGRIIGILSNQIKRQFDSSASKTGVTGVQGRVLHYLGTAKRTGDFSEGSGGRV